MNLLRLASIARFLTITILLAFAVSFQANALVIGNRVMAGAAGTNVRDSSTGAVLFTQTAGVHGTIINGPSTTSPLITGNAWQIRWDSKPPIQNGFSDGWSAESVISLAPLVGDVTQPNLSSSYYTTNNPFFPTFAPNSIGGSIGALGNCTWYANGRLRELGYNSTQLNALVGNAGNWANQATAANILVDNIPTVGSIAQLNSGSFSSLGHVAVVESVNADGTITVTESSYSTDTSSVWNFLWRRRTVSPTWFSNFIHVSPQSTSITDPDITALANTTQPVYWFYINPVINNVSKWYIVETTTSANPAVMFLNSVDPNVSGGIRWKPISNYLAYTGFPAAGINFSSVAASSDGRSITFGGLSH